MELAIPIVAIGGLYIACNQESQENFTNYELPNTNVKDKNFTFNIEENQEELTSKLATVNKYQPKTAYTDKYFSENNKLATQTMTIDGEEFYSLTGEKVQRDHFKHNNMVPYFGGTLRGNTKDMNSYEQILDNHVGSGSQYVSKQEQAPLFKPGENYQYPNGAPNQTDFMRSRVNPSNLMNNVNPFKQEQVAPGLNLGYTTEGQGGFNSGMANRELWTAKTVDEMRVSTNPKASGNNILGYEGPANSIIKQMGTQGKQEKHRPERDFEMTQDRYLTTTGLEKGQPMRSIPIQRNVTRPDTTVEYSGVAAYGNKSIYVGGEHQEPHRVQLDSYPITGVGANGQGILTEEDYGMKSKKAYPNNRSSEVDYFGAVGGAFGAAIAPLMEALAPTRKENVIGNMRLYENAKAPVNASYLFNPNDKPAATLRDTLEQKTHLNFHGNVQGGYLVTENQQAATSRATQGDFCYTGNSSASAGAQSTRSYEAEYNQRNNDIKSSTIQGRLVQGNMNLYNGQINQSAKNQYSNVLNDRPAIPNGPSDIPSIHSMGKLNGHNPLNQNINVERNSSDMYNVLKGNPYAIPYRAK